MGTPKPSMPEIKINKQRNIFDVILDKIEKVGNKLPDIVTIFLILCLIILVGSFIAGKLGWSVIDPVTEEKITAVNLINSEGIVMILTEMVNNFMAFPPLGMVLVAMIGIGFAESIGMISTLMKKTVLASPRFLILPIIVFLALVGNAAADAAFVVLPPIAAMIYMSIGRHPIAGLVVVYAAVATGFSANVIINVLDVTLAGFTQSAVEIVDPDMTVNPAMNYYFSFVATLIFVPLTVYVSRKIVEPRLGVYDGSFKEDISEVTKTEAQGLLWAGCTFVVLLIILLFLTVPENGLLRNPETGSLTDSPLMSGIIPIFLLLFFIPALVYGIKTKVIKSDKDIAEHLSKAIGGLSYYIVLSFVAAQMIAYFNWSNLGPIIAIKGADFLQNIGLTGLPLLIGFILFASLINLLVASATAKWAILAPVFVPMLMYLGFHPATTQMAYRIGDSITNAVTPMLAYFAILLMFARKYDKNMKLGTLITTLIPYTVFYAIAWILLFVIWYLLDLPLGPGFNIKL